MEMIREPERLTPVIHECDICVIGGSTTGVFAAIAASRLGAKAAVVEGLETYRGANLQPPTTTALIQGLASLREDQADFDLRKAAFDKTRYPEALRPGFMWGAFVPGNDMYMLAGTRVHNADCSIADELTEAEFEGRRQIRNIMRILRKQPGGERARLHALPARIGIRESRQVRCLHTLTQEEVLTGHRFPDAVVNGSYRVDVHFADGDGILFRYLDGREIISRADGTREEGRWREPTAESPTFYQVPYRSLAPIGSKNVLIAGRCVDADEGAFGAVRVMVNTSQMGQAAGVAAYLALSGELGVADVDTDSLRATLSDQGAIVI